MISRRLLAAVHGNPCLRCRRSVRPWKRGLLMGHNDSGPPRVCAAGISRSASSLQARRIAEPDFRSRAFHPDDVERVAAKRRDGLLGSEPCGAVRQSRKLLAVSLWSWPSALDLAGSRGTAGTESSRPTKKRRISSTAVRLGMARQTLDSRIAILINDKHRFRPH
jgi:hypothetical protein